MENRGKLELTWVDKYNRKKIESRILLENKEKSYGDLNTSNMLIHGDNLLALKALEQEFSGRIKCIYIDPPYNTGNAFEHYDDGIEHSIWLNLMSMRLEIIRKLLSEDGSLWISIDDDESHYLKVVCDEIFGRNNFISNIVWEKKSSPSNDAKWISDTHDHILVYAKNKQLWRPNKLPRTEEQNKIYKNSDEYDGINEDGSFYGRGPWFPGDMTVKTISENALYEIETPSGRKVFPAEGRAWVYSKEKFQEMVKDNRITFGKSGNNKPCIKRFITEIEDKGIVPRSVWSYKEVGENRNARQEVKRFNTKDPFSTPKPEKLLHRIIYLATNEGDIVLDSFLGSGTTAAVAHKMKRKWIGIELGTHCYTHCKPRIEKVIDGTDDGGITQIVNWSGGGGFKFYELGESLMIKDKRLGTYIINPKYSPEMICKAICKIEDFTFLPRGHFHGYSSEKRFIHITTNFINQKYIQMLGNELSEEESLLVYCTRMQSNITLPDNIEVKRIPKDLLPKCDFESEE